MRNALYWSRLYLIYLLVCLLDAFAYGQDLQQFTQVSLDKIPKSYYTLVEKDVAGERPQTFFKLNPAKYTAINNSQNVPDELELREEKPQAYYWINFGLGGSPIYNSSMALIVSLNYQRAKRLFTARYLENTEYLPLFSFSQHKVREVGVLYGLSGKGSVGYASIGAGISLVRDVIDHESWSSKGEGKENVYTGPGIPLESQLFLTTRYIGIGLVLLANVNLHYSYTAYLLVLQVGKLKNKRIRS